MSILLSGADPRELPEPVVARFARAAGARSGRVGIIVGGDRGQEQFDVLAARLLDAGAGEAEALRLVPGEPLALPDDLGRLSGLIVTDVDGAAWLEALGQDHATGR